LKSQYRRSSLKEGENIIDAKNRLLWVEETEISEGKKQRASPV